MGYDPNQARNDQGMVGAGAWRVGQRAEAVSKRALIDALRITQSADPEQLGQAYQELQRETVQQTLEAEAAERAHRDSFGVWGPAEVPAYVPSALHPIHLTTPTWVEILDPQEKVDIDALFTYARQRYEDDRRCGTPPGGPDLPTEAQMQMAEGWAVIETLPRHLRDRAAEDILTVTDYARKRINFEPYDDERRPTSHHPAVQAGQTPKQVVVDGLLFHRIDSSGIDVARVRAHRFVADRPLERGEAELMKGYLQYIVSRYGGRDGESVGEAESDTPFSFVTAHDSTKTPINRHMPELWDLMKEFVEEGTTERKDGSQALPPMENPPKLVWYTS